MVVWLFKDGESLPVESDTRRMRMGMLAHELASRGHDVHWFHSTFLHLPKKLFASENKSIALTPNYHLHLIHAGKFKRNFSIERYRFYRRYSALLSQYCETLPQPDVIVCAFPLIDVASWAVSFGKQHHIPVLIDVRDLWPDTIVDAMPRLLRPFARLLLDRDFRLTRRIFSQADSLCAMSGGVLAWALRSAKRPASVYDRVIPIGFPATFSSNNPPPESLNTILNQFADRPLFVYVGTFGHTYNIEVILSAARLLESTHGNKLHFVLAGTGPLFEAISDHAAPLTNVTLTGWLDQSAIRFLLGKASAGILPWAGLPGAMPNKFFDYLSAGLPVISSAAGELNDQLLERSAGQIFSAENAASLANAVATLVDNPALRESQAAAAAAWFGQDFSESTVYRGFADHLEQLRS
jgi:glycosyltransferase involved in cell wall biosynthesis